MAKPPKQAAVNWPAHAVEMVPLDQLVPYAKNARTHSKEQVAQIAASMKAFGWTISRTSTAGSSPATAASWQPKRTDTPKRPP